MHFKAIHEGIKYQCDQCEFKTGWTKVILDI